MIVLRRRFDYVNVEGSTSTCHLSRLALVETRKVLYRMASKANLSMYHEFLY